MALVFVGWHMSRPRSEPSIPEPAGQFQLMDIATGRISKLPSVTNPLEVHYDAGTFWILRGNEDDVAVSFVAIDETNGAVLQEIASPYASVGYFLPRGDAMWVTDYDHPEVARIDLRTGQVAQRIDLGGGPPPRFRGTSRGAEQLVLAEGSLWIGRTGEVAQVDLDADQVLRRIPLPYEWGMTVADGRVWVARQDGVTWIDPVSGHQGPVTPILRPQNLIPVGASVWVADPYGSLQEVSPDGKTRVLSTSDGLDRPLDLTRSTSSVWTADGSTRITEIPLDARQPRQITLASQAQAITAGARQMAIVTTSTGTPSTSDNAGPSTAPDRTLNMAWSRATGDPIDPALVDATTNPWMAQLSRLTCRQLTRSDVSSTAPRVVPDLAAEQPRVSGDGLTYQFTIRADQRFAPPISRPVTAEDVQFSIERSVGATSSGTGPAALLLTDVVGMPDFVRGRNRHISGITASGSSVTVRLHRLVPDLLWRLSQPSLCVVPAGSPSPSELIPPVSAAPYFVTEHVNGERTVLTRNPNLAGGAAVLDATTIVIDESLSPVEAARRVAAGTIQHASYDDPSFKPTSDVIRGDPTVPAVSYRASPLMGVHYLAFNAGRAPLDSAEVRTALSSALDPAALAGTGSTVPSRNLLPDRQSTAQPTGPAVPPVRAVEIGRTLSIGYPAGCGSCAVEADLVAQQLATVGVATTRRALDQPYLAQALDLAIGSSRLAYPDPATFLLTMLGEDVPAGWLSKVTRHGIEKLAKTQSTRRSEEAHSLAYQLRSDAPVAVYSTDVMGELTSDIECSVAPSEGLDLQSCTRADPNHRPHTTR